jgi:hypothetical protein
MNQPATSTTPSRLVRRLILGTALLIGLAVALVPRTPAVHAQETKSAPAAAAKSQSSSKTVTVTKDGTVTKVEVVKDGPGAAASATTPGDSADDEDTADEDAGKSKRRHGISIGKHGKVRIDGMSDRDFDSFGEFAHDEPAIATMVVLIVSVVFLSPVLAIGLILWYRMRKARMLNETMLKLAEKGVVSSSDALEALAGGKTAAVLSTAPGAAPLYEQARQVRRRAAWSDLRKGIITGGVGLGLTLFSMFDDRSPNSVGLVLLFVGMGFVVLWWFEERQLAPANGATAVGGAPTRPNDAGTGGPPSA